MSRPTINTLKLTREKRYRPSRSEPDHKGALFETAAFCRGEDLKRSKSARAAANLGHDKYQRDACLRIANELAYEEQQHPAPETLASSVYARRKRNAVFSQVWRLVDGCEGDVTTATVIKRGWEFTPEQLATLDVKPLLNGFLADLDRRGAANAQGWLIGFVHGEWVTPAEVFRLHLHMIVAGEMIKVVDRLREGRNYKYDKDDSVRFRVRIEREPLTHLPYPITYCFKSYWPWKHVTLTPRGNRRTRRHKRIPEPYHTQVLQFLDRHCLSDLVVLKHVSVKGGGLHHSQPAKRRKK